MRLWQNSNRTLAAALLGLALLGGPTWAQTPNPPPGGGGSGTGCVPAGTAGSVLVDTGAGACTSDGDAKLTNGALGLGGSGTAGSVAMGNVTSGTVTLQPTTGALGAAVLSLPADTDTIADLAGAQVLSNKTLTSPVLNGTATGTAVSTSAAASKLVKTDANSNLFSNNLLGNASLTVGTGGTTTLTAASSRYQALSTAAQTYVLPDATTLSLGPWFVFNNNTSGTLTINKNGGALQYSVPAGGISSCGPTDISTAAGNWDCHSYVPSSASWGTGVTGLQMNNVLSTTPQIGAGASSCSTASFIPQRAVSSTGFGGAGTNVCGIVGGVTTFTSTATAFNIPSGATYQVNGAQIACANLSNGATGCSTATGTSGATIPLLNGANTWSGVQSFTDGDLTLLGASSGSSVVKAPATGGGTATLPAGSGTLVYSTGAISPTLTSAHILVGNVSNVATDTALTGDASITNAGVWTNTGATGNFAVGGNFTLTGTVAPTLANGTVGIYSAGTGSGAVFTGQGTTSDIGFFNAAQTGGLQVSHAGKIALFGVTTGTNADFMCLSSGGVIQLQASACTISSLRFKKNVQAFTASALDRLQLLSVDTFYYRAANKDQNGNVKQLGLIAENVAKVLPICAEYEPDGKTPKSYKQECLIGLLVKGIQEQQKQLQGLRLEVAALKRERN